jgi:hypothetical protein
MAGSANAGARAIRTLILAGVPTTAGGPTAPITNTGASQDCARVQQSLRLPSHGALGARFGVA